MPKVIVTEAQWLAAGMDKFAQSGVDALVIEKMSSELGCSKSSFYWYFKNRHEFVARIVERWMEMSTQEVIRNASALERAEDQITSMLKQMFAVTGKGDFLYYLRKMASTNPDFLEKLESIEQTRLSYAQELLVKAGMDRNTGEQKAYILYHYYLGWYERNKQRQIGEDELDRHIGMLREQLLGIQEQG